MATGHFDLARLHFLHKTCWVDFTLGSPDLTERLNVIQYMLYMVGSCRFHATNACSMAISQCVMISSFHFFIYFSYALLWALYFRAILHNSAQFEHNSALISRNVYLSHVYDNFCLELPFKDNSSLEPAI